MFLELSKGRPCDRFQKITHIQILEIFLSLPFAISQMRICENPSVLAQGSVTIMYENKVFNIK
jgi:hypothetical protein